MKKIIYLNLLMLLNINSYASVSVTNTNDDPIMYNSSNLKFEALANLKSLIGAINKAQTIQDDIQALTNLKNFANDPANAIINVNATVTKMLDNFNTNAGTRFTNLQQLINSLASSTSATGTLINLNQASNIQLQTISQLLMQIEAENQAILKYKQAEIEEAKYKKVKEQQTREAISKAISRY